MNLSPQTLVVCIETTVLDADNIQTNWMFDKFQLFLPPFIFGLLITQACAKLNFGWYTVIEERVSEHRLLDGRVRRSQISNEPWSLEVFLGQSLFCQPNPVVLKLTGFVIPCYGSTITQLMLNWCEILCESRLQYLREVCWRGLKGHQGCIRDAVHSFLTRAVVMIKQGG